MIISLNGCDSIARCATKNSLCPGRREAENQQRGPEGGEVNFRFPVYCWHI
jgi:hypothetical protein